MRYALLKDWYHRGDLSIKNNNAFEAFIYLWISWVIGCRVYFSYNLQIDLRKDNTDRKEILLWCKLHAGTVREIIENNFSTLQKLGSRKGDKYGDPIIDAGKFLTEYFATLSRYFKNEYDYNDDKQLALHFGELLNKIRNNLFHGDKTYNSKNDYELIEAVLPTLRDLVKITVKYSDIVESDNL